MVHKQKYFLRTERMGFRYWTQNDFDLAAGLWGDIEVTKLIDTHGQLSENQIKERLAKEIAIAESFGVQYWPIFVLSSDSHVGCCGLRPYDFPAGIYEIGYHICSKYWRHGYASEAARAVMKYAFGKLEAVSLFAGHHPKNKISRQLLVRLGFRYTHDEYYAPTGLNHPSYTMTMNEFTKLRNPD
jgi:ribosomal-protein-alanine N-acetyltransferase